MKHGIAVIFLFLLSLSVGGSFLAVGSSGGQAPPAAPQADNPFFKPYGTPFNVPPLHLIKNEHFLPAIEEGIRREAAEVEAIVSNPEPPAFENTIAALDHTGIFLDEVTSVFFSLQSAHTNRELQALAQKTAPMLAAHGDNIALNEKLFRRVKAVYDGRDGLNLDREQRFLLENTYRGFVRSGALLDERQKARLRELNQKLSLLTVRFGENVLAETNAFRL
ncbi:MAG: M3 family metallopeptidase, partial [Candidatus Aminicenantes bacterium]|nr:M3 family metallopeptidase [Candidatus Aminicenantes bacterium]